MIEVFIFSEAGGHRDNEDAFEFRQHPDDAATCLCALADGQGGQPGGGPAARLACARCVHEMLSHGPSQLRYPSAWPTLLSAVDREVAEEPTAGFTTLAAFRLTENAVAGASSGDSAVALFNSGLRAQILTERQHKNPPVGSGTAVFVPFAASLSPPWTLLAMSDGVWKYAGWEAVSAAAERAAGNDIIPFLRKRAALPRTGQLQDDFTLVVLRG